jgi:hypothetical protein
VNLTLSPHIVGRRCVRQPAVKSTSSSDAVLLHTGASTKAKTLYDLSVRKVDPLYFDRHMEKHGESPPLERGIPELQIFHRCPFSAAVAFSELHSCPIEYLASGDVFFEHLRSNTPTSPYLSVERQCSDPGKLAQLESMLTGKQEKVNKLTHEAQIRQEYLLNIRRLQEQSLYIKGENKSFLEYLKKKNEQCKKKPKDPPKENIQDRREKEQKRQILLTARYIKPQAEDLTTQFLQSKKISQEVKPSTKHTVVLKERHETKLELLQKKDKVAKDWKAHCQFVQQKTLLETKMNELDQLDSKTLQLRDRAQPSELSIRAAHLQSRPSVTMENEQLRKKLNKLTKDFHKVEYKRSHYKKLNQELKKDPLYQTLFLGRPRSEVEDEINCQQCQKEQNAQKIRQSSPQGTRRRSKLQGKHAFNRC